MSTSSSDLFDQIAARATLAAERSSHADFYMTTLFLADIRILTNRAADKLEYEKECKRRAKEAGDE